MTDDPASDPERKLQESSLEAERLMREIIGRELRELYEISEELPDYLKELLSRIPDDSR